MQTTTTTTTNAANNATSAATVAEIAAQGGGDGFGLHVLCGGRQSAPTTEDGLLGLLSLLELDANQLTRATGAMRCALLAFEILLLLLMLTQRKRSRILSE